MLEALVKGLSPAVAPSVSVGVSAAPAVSAASARSAAPAIPVHPSFYSEIDYEMADEVDGDHEFSNENDDVSPPPPTRATTCEAP